MTPHTTNMKQTLLFVIGCTCLCLIAGCTTPSRHKAVVNPAIEKLNAAREVALACIMYADAHGGQYPPNLPATAGYCKTNILDQLVANFDLVYSGAVTNIANPSATIVLKEKQAWQSLGGSKLLKAYGFADGHAEIHTSEDGNFDKWEDERIVKP